MTCYGTDIKLSIIPSGKTSEQMIPFAPKKYTLVAGAGDIAVAANIGKAELANPTGSIDITAFDARRIAGTIELNGTLSGGELVLTGGFDISCPRCKVK